MATELQTAFISYSREDSEFALKLSEDLKAAGAAVWLDQLDIAPGQRWARAVEDALHACPRMLVILSPASVNSTNVEDEVSLAIEEHKTVIPVLYRECRIPFRLRPFQYVDFRTDYALGLEILTKALADQKPAIPVPERKAEPVSPVPELEVTGDPPTWQPQASGARLDLHSIALTSERSGCAVGDYGTILRTEDGQRWERQPTITVASLYSIVFGSTRLGWIVGEGGAILHTEDGGASWTPQIRFTDKTLLSASFVNEKSGWAVGAEGTILHTVDGLSWTPQTSGTGKDLTSVAFINEQSGWVVGQDGVILRTDDGGATWTPQTSNSKSIKKSLYSVAMVTPQLGWAVGETDILHSDDGTTWSVQGLDPKLPLQAYGALLGRALRSVYFRTTNRGWAVGNNIHYTEDGGKTWGMEQRVENILLKSVVFPTFYSGWVVGTKGTILHWSEAS